MWLITQEDLNAFIFYESLKSYTSINVVRLEGLSATNQYYGLPRCVTVI
jgi:hypothetical protein